MPVGGRRSRIADIAEGARRAAAPAPPKGTTSTNRRNSAEVKAKRAQVLLDDPNLRAVFDTAHAECVREIERVTLDGSPEKERAALEMVRQLQALNQVKRVIMRPLVAEQMNKARIQGA